MSPGAAVTSRVPADSFFLVFALSLPFWLIGATGTVSNMGFPRALSGPDARSRPR